MLETKWADRASDWLSTFAAHVTALHHAYVEENMVWNANVNEDENYDEQYDLMRVMRKAEQYPKTLTSHHDWFVRVDTVHRCTDQDTENRQT